MSGGKCNLLVCLEMYDGSCTEVESGGFVDMDRECGFAYVRSKRVFVNAGLGVGACEDGSSGELQGFDDLGFGDLHFQVPESRDDGPLVVASLLGSVS